MKKSTAFKKIKLFMGYITKIAVMMFFVGVSAKAMVADNFYEKLEGLLNQKKYYQAFNLLETADPDNTNPDLVYQKAHVILNYYGKCLVSDPNDKKPKTFALKDLEKDESLEQVREGDGRFKIFVFEVESALNEAIKKTKNNGKFHLLLGHYHYKKMCNKEPDEEKAKQHLLKAYQNKEHDILALRELGVIYLGQNDSEKSLAFLKEAYELNKNDPVIHYNLALAYFKQKEYSNAAKFAVLSFDHYKSEKLKSESAILATYAFLDMKDKDKALKYAKLANNHKDANEYYVLSQLLRIYSEMGELALLDEMADALFAGVPNNPVLAQEIMQIMYSAKLEQNLLTFFDRNIKKFNDQQDVLGNLYFHRASFYLGPGNDQQKAHTDIAKAKSYFTDTVKNANKVFKEIEKMEQKLFQSNTNVASIKK